MIYVAAFFIVFSSCLIEFFLLFLGLSSIVDGIEANTFLNIPTILFSTIYESHYTILVNFYIYLTFTFIYSTFSKKFSVLTK